MSMKEYVDGVVAGAVRRGVDEVWIEDARAALTAALRAGASGELGAQELAELSALVADAMAEERKKRGGVKKDDPLEMLRRAASESPEIETLIGAIVESVARGAARGQRAAGGAKKTKPKKE